MTVPSLIGERSRRASGPTCIRLVRRLRRDPSVSLSSPPVVRPRTVGRQSATTAKDFITSSRCCWTGRWARLSPATLIATPPGHVALHLATDVAVSVVVSVRETAPPSNVILSKQVGLYTVNTPCPTKNYNINVVQQNVTFNAECNKIKLAGPWINSNLNYRILPKLFLNDRGYWSSSIDSDKSHSLTLRFWQYVQLFFLPIFGWHAHRQVDSYPRACDVQIESFISQASRHRVITLSY